MKHLSGILSPSFMSVSLKRVSLVFLGRVSTHPGSLALVGFGVVWAKAGRVITVLASLTLQQRLQEEKQKEQRKLFLVFLSIIGERK